MACPGQEVHFVCTTNSPLVAWSSTEYIGPRGIRIEFSAALDSVGTTVTMMGAEATLLGVNGDNVTSSKLVITVSQAASVTCDDGIQSVTSTFEVPGMLHIVYIVYAMRTKLRVFVGHAY